MAVYAFCSVCSRHHRRGTKIFTKHKESLGMYKDESTGSRIGRMHLPTTIKGRDTEFLRLIGHK